MVFNHFQLFPTVFNNFQLFCIHAQRESQCSMYVGFFSLVKVFFFKSVQYEMNMAKKLLIKREERTNKYLKSEFLRLFTMYLIANVTGLRLYTIQHLEASLGTKKVQRNQCMGVTFFLLSYVNTFTYIYIYLHMISTYQNTLP